MTTLHRIARAIDDGLFDRVFQPLLDRTGWNPAWLAPGLIGAAFAAAVARVMLLYGAGQLAAHVFDAGLFVAAVAATYRLYLRHLSAHPACAGVPPPTWPCGWPCWSPCISSSCRSRSWGHPPPT